MRLPESASLVGSLLSGLGRSAHTFTESTDVPDVTEALLVEALEAMARGDIEYVILEDGSAFLQAAGSGDSAYQVQYRRSEAEPLTELSGSIDSQTARRVMLAFRRGDGGWRTAGRWTPVAD